MRLGGPIQERVLTMLLLEDRQVVTVSRLIEAVWEAEPPRTAVQQIRKTVAGLRQRIPRGAELIVTEGAGYRTILGPGQLDLHDFRRMGQEAASAVAEGRPADAAEKLRAGLALWRGTVMCGQGGPVLDAAATALEEHRLAAEEQLFELRLEAGEGGELVGDLRRAVDGNPLRERLRSRLMLALYRSGQQAEALAEYGRVRELLAEELGIDPGEELVRLHEDILRGSPALAPTRIRRAPVPREPARTGAEFRTPCTLPYDLSDFTGRDRELGLLLKMAEQPDTRLVGIDGMGGAGKTTLAVHAAHQLAEAYPDGQVYIDLRGFSPEEQPLQADFAVAALLRDLGASEAQIPDDVQGRLALWRSWTADRRLLLILDNAVDTAQVRPLLAGLTQGFVIVTGRVRLVDLDSAQWLSLGSMEPEESALMLTRTLGEERVAAEPKAARALAEQCGQLPLALRIITARLSKRSHWTLQYLVGRLHDESRRLKELCSDERSVATTIQLSYQVLEPEYQRAFRLLGLHAGKDIDVHAAAALLGTTPPDAEVILEGLLDVHLLRQTVIGLYSFHDLVRSFTRGLQQVSAHDEEARTALGGLLDYYVTATDEACRVLFPGRVEYACATAGPPPQLPPLKCPAEARQWFNRELSALRQAVHVGREHGYPRQAAYLARNAVFQLHGRGDIRGYLETGEAGLVAARQADDPVAVQFSLRNVIAGHSMLGEYRRAADAIEEGLRLAKTDRDRRREGVYLSQLGWVYSALGRLAEGRQHLEEAVHVCAETRNAMEEAIALCNLSSVYSWLGRADEAVARARRSVRLSDGMNQVMYLACALNDLAIAHLAGGDHRAALVVLDQVLELGSEATMPRNRALTHVLMADVCQRDGRGDSAPAFVKDALDLVEPLGTRPWQSEIENIAGLVHRRRGEYDRALELHRRAFQHAAASEFRIQMAWALDGLAQASQGAGDLTAAAEYRRSADGHFDAMGVPDENRSRV
ncbi:AfsR/SARP family transcriptional regulator [Streptomyces guryensis]|uniref:Tetratricopeptide repeat protein n=1 Tax=Streptomyces guryensis TaxID=2886947 RepID=A0A9Q3ZBT1_9ACTN|nr:BTAD domain-containing putative transcriptional regulator [Streptomyces guryensis]MCD9880649.1 tetratricopeptide repeat protein [Streptomyces guryensis]